MTSCRCLNGVGCAPCRVWGKWRGRPPLADRLREIATLDLCRLAFEEELRAEVQQVLREAAELANPVRAHTRAAQRREYRKQARM
jgi:hypothetical protein